MNASAAPRFVTRALVASLTTVAFLLGATLLVVTFSVRDQVRQSTVEKLETGRRLLAALELRRAEDAIQTVQALDDRYAAEVSSLTGVRTLIVAGDRLLATSLDPDAAAALAPDLLRTFASADGAVLGGEEYAVRPLLREDGAAVYLLESIDAAARPQVRAWMKRLTAGGLGAFALAVLVSLWLGRAVSDPIDSLTRSIGSHTGARGVDGLIELSGASRELDNLTAALNGMIAGTRAREHETLQAYLEAVRALAVALDERDPHTAGHSQRVASLATAVGRKMHLDDATLEVLRLGALLHDVGKIGVSEELLGKPGPLTSEEYEAVKAHPTVGSRILQNVTFLEPHLPIIELHHERPDGGGYPYGLKGNDIPVLARIVHVVDAYDAMTTARPYRPALPASAALSELHRCAGTDFDADVVKVLTAVLADDDVFPAEGVEAFAPAAPAAVEKKPRGPGLRAVPKSDPLDAFGSEEQTA
jgi:putative nucleotidyltransferase with HDIG domain